MAVKTIFPVTRIHEPLRVEVNVQGGQVVDAKVGAMLFRGFEAIMAGRDPRDAALLTQRICGICSSAHAVAASIAQRQAFQVELPPNGQHLTNLITTADMIQNHLRHFYALALYDYVAGPDFAPYTPRMKGDYRLPSKINAEILVHAREAVRMAARAHEMMALFGAKAPHQQTIIPTGVTAQAAAEQLTAFSGILHELAEWVKQVYLPDVMTIADYYQDYYQIGAGYGNLLSFGMFPDAQGHRLFQPGAIIGRGAVQSLDVNSINEEIRYSWYRDDQQSRPPATGVTIPDIDKQEAYSWLKAPRYQGMPFECGSLARGWINGDYNRGISVMDRLMARARETDKLCRLAQETLAQVVPGAPASYSYTMPPQGEGAGIIDTMRGVLGHWMRYKDFKVEHYQIITPTTWNFAPRDNNGQRGPVEEALIGTPVVDEESLIEVGRVIRSLDPCFTCAVHTFAAPAASAVRLC